MNNSFELFAASHDDGLDVLQMLQEIGLGENGFTNSAHNLGHDGWPEYLAFLIKEDRGIELAPRRVPQTTYWLRRNGYPIAINLEC